MTQTLDQIVAQVELLPRLPDTAVRLLRVIGDATSSLDQIVDTIRYDQAMTAEVLRRSNAAAIGAAGRVTSVEDAIRILGTARVLQLVMAAHVQTLLNRAQEGYGLPPGALWAHSVAVAIGSQQLARRQRLRDSSLIFTAGLLHDIGKVVLNEYVGREYAEIVRIVESESLSFCEAEQRVLGFTHPEIGSRLAEKWELPPAIVQCIRYHHDPLAQDPGEPLVDLVHLADALCLSAGIGGGHDGLLYRVHPGVLERYRLSLRDLECLAAEIVVELRTVQSYFRTN